MWLDVAFKPATWASAQFGLMFIADYASRYWTTVNHPHRMFDDGQIIPKFSWNTAKAEIHNDWAKLQYNRNQFHYHWGYEGDLFDIYQAETDPYNLLMITGRAMPEWYQLNMEGKAGDIELQYGEPITDYKQGFYLKYKNIFGSNINFFYVDHEIPYGDEGERMSIFSKIFRKKDITNNAKYIIPITYPLVLFIPNEFTISFGDSLPPLSPIKPE